MDLFKVRVPPDQRQQKGRYRYPPEALEGLASETIADSRIILVIEDIFHGITGILRVFGHGPVSTLQRVFDETLKSALLGLNVTKVAGGRCGLGHGDTTALRRAFVRERDRLDCLRACNNYNESHYDRQGEPNEERFPFFSTSPDRRPISTSPA